MGFTTGLKRIQEASTQSSNGDFPNKLKIAPDSTVTIRLINEFDENSADYDPDRGLVGLIDLHTHPDQSQWFKRAECTMSDTGRCYGCEIGLKRKRRLFMNLLADDADGNPTVFYYDVSVWKSPIYSMLLEVFTEDGSVSNRTFKIKRKGSGIQDTEYIVRPGAPDSTPFDWEGIKPYDLSELLPTLSYEEQRELFAVTAPTTKEAEEASDSSAWI